MTQAYLCCKYHGTPVPLSNGVPLLTRRGIESGIQIEVRTPFSGGLIIPIVTLGAGPGSGEEEYLNAGPCAGWNQHRTIPIHTLDAEYLEPVTRPGGHKPFADLSSTEPFWVKDSKAGTHVLMDVNSRRLFRVSPVNRNLRREFWWGIAQGKKGVLNPVPESPTFADKWAEYGYYDRGVYLCIHPAPYEKENPRNWTFDGHGNVSFDIDGEEPAERACFSEEKLMMGYASSALY